jgi:hypothetical protein
VLYFNKRTCLQVTGKGLTYKTLLHVAKNVAASVQRAIAFIVCTFTKTQRDVTPEEGVVKFG